MVTTSTAWINTLRALPSNLAWSRLEERGFGNQDCCAPTSRHETRQQSFLDQDLLVLIGLNLIVMLAIVQGVGELSGLITSERPLSRRCSMIPVARKEWLLILVVMSAA
jgi:hypothetical protein